MALEWKNNPWFDERKRSLVFKRDELLKLSVEEFRYFFFGYSDPRGAIHQFLETTKGEVPQHLIPEFLRWIDATGNMELMAALSQSKHPLIMLWRLKTQPQSWKSPTDYDEWKAISTDPSFYEIVYQICTIPWPAERKAETFDVFFRICTSPKPPKPKQPAVPAAAPAKPPAAEPPSSAAGTELCSLCSFKCSDRCMGCQASSIAGQTSPSRCQAVTGMCGHSFHAHCLAHFSSSGVCPEDGKPWKLKPARSLPVEPTDEEEDEEEEADEEEEGDFDMFGADSPTAVLADDDAIREYFLSSPNCDLTQLAALVPLVSTANECQILWRSATAGARNPFAPGCDIGIAILTKLFSIGNSCFGLLSEIVQSVYIAQNVDFVLRGISTARLEPRRKLQLQERVGSNPHLTPKKLSAFCRNRSALLKSLLRRADFLTQMTVEEALQLVGGEDDLLYELLENQGSKIQWSPERIDVIFAYVMNDCLLTGIAFSKAPGLPWDVLSGLAAASDHCRMTLATRSDLPPVLVEELLRDKEPEVVSGILKHDPRPDVQRRFAAVPEVKYLASLASNPALDPALRVNLFRQGGPKAFRVLRILAVRTDLTAEEIASLLRQRDLDVYSNLARNKAAALTREHVVQLSTFAQVPDEQVREWLPCLRLMHAKVKNEEQLCKMVISYQSEIRLLLLRTDQEHGLNRVDSEMKQSWATDPDFSVTLGVISSSGEKLSNFTMQEIVANGANAHLVEDKLMTLLSRCDDMNLDTLLAIVKHGTANVCKEILKLLPGGQSLFALASASGQLAGVKGVSLNSEALAQPKFYLHLLRSIYTAHRTQAAVMRAIIAIMKHTRQTIGVAYDRNEDHIKTLTEDLLLDISTDIRVPREIMDDLVSISSSTVLYHLLSYSNLSYDTLWSIFLREIANSGNKSSLLRCLALRSSLPDTMRWVLALAHSKLFYQKKSDPKNAERNELLSVMLSSGNTVPKDLIHYFITAEPDEIPTFLHSSELGPAELQFIRDSIFPSLKESSPVRQHFEIFAAAATKLCGQPITLDDLAFNKLTSKIMNDTISYARDGIQLQELGKFITESLGVAFSIKIVDDLLKALTILFEEPRPKEEPSFRKGAGDGDAPAAPEEEVHSLPITSLQKAREHFPKIVLSCDLRQYLVKYIEAGFLAINPSLEGPVIVIPPAHQDLFGEGFSATLNDQLDRLLNFTFTSAAVKSRRSQITVDILKKLLGHKHCLIKDVRVLATTLQIPDSRAFDVLSLLIKSGLGDAAVRDLSWLVTRLFELCAQIPRQPNATTAAPQGPQEGAKPDEGLVELDSVLLTPLLDTAKVFSLPYAVVFNIYELMPDVLRLRFPTRLLTLLTTWGAPAQTESRSCQELLSRVQFAVDSVELSGAACVKSIIASLESPKPIDVRYALRQSQLHLELLVPNANPSDVSLHVCNLEAVEDALYAAITKLSQHVCDVLTAMFKHWKEMAQFQLVDVRVKPVSELKAAETVGMDLLKRLVAHAEGALLQHRTCNLEELSAYIRPFAQLITIQPIVYKKGARAQMMPGNLLFRLHEFIPGASLLEWKVDKLPLALEIADYCVHKVEQAWLDCKEPMNVVCALHVKDLLQLPDSHNYAFLAAPLLNRCLPRVTVAYQEFLAEKEAVVRQLLERAAVELLVVPDFTKLEKKKVLETEPVAGLFMVQHALLLDENSMPIVKDDELLRDERSAKTRQPVLRIVQVEKEVPTAKAVEQMLAMSGVLERVPAFHLSFLLARLRSFEERLDRALATVWNGINQPYLRDLLSGFKESFREGLQLSLPSGRPGPPYQYLILPNEGYYAGKMTQLEKIAGSPFAQSEANIKDFTISNRPTVSLEMISYLQLLETCSFKPESKLRRLAEAAVCATALNSDVNYHGLLDDTSMIKFLYDIVKRIGERLLQMEAQRNGGTLLVAFPSTDKGGLGVMCISSHYKRKQGKWDRFLHYNPNACAAEEFAACCGQQPPAQVQTGVVFEEVFSGANKRNILISFSKQAIKQKKSSLNEQTLDVLKKGDLHDESHLGRALNLGHINWVVHKENALTLNHLACEAALCNASPLVPLEVNADGVLVLKVTFASVIEVLRTVSAKRTNPPPPAPAPKPAARPGRR